MSSNPTQTVKTYVDGMPRVKWSAIINSVIASVCLALMFPLFYLFIDLLAYQGIVPNYSSLPGSVQQRFREEWIGTLSNQPDVQEQLQLIRPTPIATAITPVTEWEARWHATNAVFLARRVGQDAASLYLPADRSTPRDDLGLLSLVIRERNHWTGQVLAWVASWNKWTWKPIINESANGLYLIGLFSILFFLAIVRGIAMYMTSHSAVVLTIEVASQLRRAVYTHAQRLSAVAIRPDLQSEAGEIVTRKIDQVQDGVIASLTGAIRGPVIVVLLTILLFSAHFWLTVVLVALSLIVWLVAGQAATWFRRDARVASRRAEARLGMIRESLSRMQLAKAYLMERFIQTRFERHLTDLSKSALRRQRSDTLSRPMLVTIISLAVFAMSFLAGWVVLSGEMSIAGFITKSLCIAALIVSIGRWIAARVRVRKANEAAADVFEFLDRRADAGQSIDAEFLPPLTKKLELQDVSLRELGTGRMLLEKVSFAIPALSTTAIIAPDVTESHALAYILTRFYDPTAGEIRVDGKNTRWVTLESVRMQIALVLEQSLTFSDSIANNIGCGDPSFTLPQIIEAAKIAHVHQFVQRLSYGYETPIGDAGLSLSLGERYRIALARAILRDPSVLVIEEPLETLDADSMVLVDDTLARIQTNRTLIFLARRPTTIKKVDRVFVLQDGKLAASGSHQDLLNSSDLYRALHFKQNVAAGTI